MSRFFKFGKLHVTKGNGEMSVLSVISKQCFELILPVLSVTSKLCFTTLRLVS